MKWALRRISCLTDWLLPPVLETVPSLYPGSFEDRPGIYVDRNRAFPVPVVERGRRKFRICTRRNFVSWIDISHNRNGFSLRRAMAQSR